MPASPSPRKAYQSTPHLVAPDKDARSCIIPPGRPPFSRPLARADGTADAPGGRLPERAKTAYLRCAETTPCKIPLQEAILEDAHSSLPRFRPLSSRRIIRAPGRTGGPLGGPTGHGSKQLRFGSTGNVTTATVAQIEREEIAPHMTTLRKLAQGLKVDPAELVGE
jgi:DNA-binding XRE family transcriptional regulator